MRFSIFLRSHAFFTAGLDSDEVQPTRYQWVATWDALMMAAGENAPDVSGQALRLIVHATPGATLIGGPVVVATLA
jgi:hypothetical protein